MEESFVSAISTHLFESENFTIAYNEKEHVATFVINFSSELDLAAANTYKSIVDLFISIAKVNSEFGEEALSGITVDVNLADRSGININFITFLSTNLVNNDQTHILELGNVDEINFLIPQNTYNTIQAANENGVRFLNTLRVVLEKYNITCGVFSPQQEEM